MNFWTMFAANDSWPTWMMRNNFPFQLRGAVEKGDLGTLVLVKPTGDDLRALGNALIYQAHEDYVVAVPAQLADQNVWQNLRARDNAYSDWISDNPHGASLIVNGEATTVCSGCDRIVRRAAGECIPGLRNCAKKLFTGSADIILPDSKLFMPPKHCCEYAPFTSYSLDRIIVDSNPLKPVTGNKVHHRSITRGVAGRAINKVFPKHCMFASADGNRCSNSDRRCHRCTGPIYESDIPEPTLQDRRLLRMAGTRIPADRYYEVATKHKWLFSPDWRVERDLFVGVSMDASKLNLCIRGNNFQDGYNAKYTPSEDWNDVMAEFGLSYPELTTSPSLMEKTLICLLGSGNYHRGPTIGFGLSTTLTSLRMYGDDEVVIQYSGKGRHVTYRAIGHLDLIQVWPAIPWTLSHSYSNINSRSQYLKGIMYDKHEELNGYRRYALLKSCADTLTKRDKEEGSCPDVGDWLLNNAMQTCNRKR